MTQSAQHVERSVQDQQGQPQHVRVNLGESPLSWLHARGRLSDRQFLAGEAIRLDWEKAGLGSKITMRWDAAPLSKARRGAPSAADPTLSQMSARNRFDGAIAMAGPRLADVLWRVACAGEGLAAAEKALGWPARAGKLVLTLALDRVAEFYRIPD
ncbi:DUF6456 domain-containing protein [Sphingobium phenoxybenzoativorans]|uniref:DUF6456 domain-containing protein n=1 Tax=Sphingobium phenoxybenzoativorans TaxID=1592790 RepID=UPI000871C769|nr:DUF6456 domain-containing protein [Sphingobium phenoxybenzoativorans]